MAPANVAVFRAIIARLRAAEADAKRYRWLAKQNADLSVDSFLVLSQDCTDEDGLRYWVGADLDAAIDSEVGS